jgi:hypothetical protein
MQKCRNAGVVVFFILALWIVAFAQPAFCIAGRVFKPPAGVLT